MQKYRNDNVPFIDRVFSAATQWFPNFISELNRAITKGGTIAIEKTLKKTRASKQIVKVYPIFSWYIS